MNYHVSKLKIAWNKVRILMLYYSWLLARCCRACQRTLHRSDREREGGGWRRRSVQRQRHLRLAVRRCTCSQGRRWRCRTCRRERPRSGWSWRPEAPPRLPLEIPTGQGWWKYNQVSCFAGTRWSVSSDEPDVKKRHSSDPTNTTAKSGGPWLPHWKEQHIGNTYYGLVNMCGSFTVFTICAQNTKGNPKTAKSQQRVDEQANTQNVHALYLVVNVREQEYDSKLESNT